MVRKLIVLVLVLTLTTLVISPVQAQEGPQNWNPTLPAEASALHAVALMYVPVNNASWWTAAICSDMTAGGCEYFKNKQADTLLQKGQGVTGGGVQNFEIVEELQQGLQVWKMTVTVWSGQNKKLTQDVYALATFDEAQGKWLVERILYGPYLGFAK